MSSLVVYTFASGWGLPTTGPFALKLLKWLDLAGLSYRQVIENNPGKGPKGKNPWIVLDGEAIADSEAIIALLAQRTGFYMDAGLGEYERGLGHAVRRMLEEHFHQVLEWELFVHPAGADYIGGEVRKSVPALLAGPIAARFCGHFRKQLFARGIARHPPEAIAAKGKGDIVAFETLLGTSKFIGGDHPSMGDVTAYGLISPMARWPMRTPVADFIKTRPRVMNYLDRVGTLTSQRDNRAGEITVHADATDSTPKVSHCGR